MENANIIFYSLHPQDNDSKIFMELLAKNPGLDKQFVKVCVYPNLNNITIPAIIRQINTVPVLIASGFDKPIIGKDAVSWIQNNPFNSDQANGFDFADIGNGKFSSNCASLQEDSGNAPNSLAQFYDNDNYNNGFGKADNKSQTGNNFAAIDNVNRIDTYADNGKKGMTDIMKQKLDQLQNSRNMEVNPQNQQNQQNQQQGSPFGRQGGMPQGNGFGNPFNGNPQGNPFNGNPQGNPFAGPMGQQGGSPQNNPFASPMGPIGGAGFGNQMGPQAGFGNQMGSQAGFGNQMGPQAGFGNQMGPQSGFGNQMGQQGHNPFAEPNSSQSRNQMQLPNGFPAFNPNHGLNQEGQQQQQQRSAGFPNAGFMNNVPNPLANNNMPLVPPGLLPRQGQQGPQSMQGMQMPMQFPQHMQAQGPQGPQGMPHMQQNMPMHGGGYANNPMQGMQQMQQRQTQTQMGQGLSQYMPQQQGQGMAAMRSFPNFNNN
jgi:hypothetical protein